MDVHDKLPLSLLTNIRDAVLRPPADEAGMITSTIPTLRNAEAPHRISVNKDAYLTTIEAAIARRGVAEAGGAK